MNYSEKAILDKVPFIRKSLQERIGLNSDISVVVDSNSDTIEQIVSFGKNFTSELHYKPIELDVVFSRKDKLVQAIYNNNSPIALTVSYHDPSFAKNMYLLDFIAILPEYQGKKIGSFLMDTVEYSAKKAGYDEMLLFSITDHSNRVYESRGYEVSGPADQIGVPMIKKLPINPNVYLSNISPEKEKMRIIKMKPNPKSYSLNIPMPILEPAYIN
jgi:GNAT superfamily N-acetyltransferase